VIRVNALDTFEHVTDFDSAGDHAMTLMKFQELNLPVSLPQSSKKGRQEYGRGHESPFEPRYDNVSGSEGSKEQGAQLYRHSGPWLGGQSEIQFQAYLQQLRRRKPELLKQLREQYVNKVTAERRKKAQDEGGLDAEHLNEKVEVTDAEFQAWLKDLRTNKRLAGAELTRLLDLHTLSSDIPSIMMGRTDYYEANATRLSSVDYAHQGPPRTHPSAGLAYTRSGAFISNHPSFGPQQNMRPVEARCLIAKTRKRKHKRRAVLGVGGIAYEDETDSSEDHLRGIEYLDPSMPGGGRVWVSPRRVSIASQGSISLEAARAERDVLAPYGVSNYMPSSKGTNISQAARSTQRSVPQLDKSSEQLGPRARMGAVSELIRGA
jgi:Mitochondrial ribosomal protein subunit